MNKFLDEYRRIESSAATKVVGITFLALISLATLTLLFLSLVGNRFDSIFSLDNLLSLMFLGLFGFLLWLSNNRRVFIVKNWWLLLGAVPLGLIDNRTAVALAIINALAVVHFIIRISLLVRISRRLVPRTYALIIATSLASTILISTALFYSAEHTLNPNVNTYFDSFWWAIVTGTTIGYGDIVPVTTTGRWVGIVLMIFGLGIFGFVTGSVASILSGRAKKIATPKRS